MKKELLKKIKRMFDNSGREGCYYGDPKYDSISVEFGYNLAIQELIDEINSLPDSEPLDPYTCELCVGDEVSAEFGIFFWEGLIVVNPKDDDNKVVLYYPQDGYIKRFFRSMCKLEKRNGATIKSH